MNKRLYKNLFISLLFVFVLFSIFVFLNQSFNSYNEDIYTIFYSFGKLCGLLGFLFLSILIISGDSARFFDRIFGMDRIIKFQRKFSLFIAIFILLHPIFFFIADFKMISYLIPKAGITPIFFGSVSFYLFFIILTCSYFYKRISYRAWQYIHILNYVLFFTALYHGLNMNSNLDLKIKFIFYTLAFFVILGFVYRTIYKLKAKSFKFNVEDIIWETKDVFTIKLLSNKKINFLAGQFCFLRLKQKNLHARHPFTISNSPGEKTINFTIKIKGRFTQALSKLKKGDEVILDGPFGNFFITEEKKNLVLIAGGVGITPFASIIKDKLKKDNQQKIILLYSCKTEKDIIFKNFFDSVQKNWFKIVYFLSREKKKNYEYGRINEESIDKYVKNFNNCLFYICGPEEMKNDIIKILKKKKVKNKDIKFESFFW